MGPSPSPRLLVIAGATATGKTGLAVELANAIGGEIVGADSVQVYRRLDIGSAKPTPSELRGVPHHLIDVVDLDAPFDAARHVELADAAIAGVVARGRKPIVVGGSGLYLRALVRGLAPGIPADPSLRAALHERAARGELAAMHAELTAVDPAYAARISPNDPIRIVRALEVLGASGEPISVHHARHAAMGPRYPALFVALQVVPSTLRARIAARTHAMLTRGWIDEVRAILDDGYDPRLKPLRSVGYAEVVRYVREGGTLDDLEAQVVQATRAFAKRQRTWFRGERGIEWVEPEDLAGGTWRRRIETHFDEH